MRVGATLEKSELGYWEDKLEQNHWMRVFPNTDGLIPVTSDARYQYLLETQPAGKRVVFVSSKVYAKYGGAYLAGIDICLDRIKALIDAGFDEVWYAEHHEAEADMTPAQYHSIQNQMFDKIETLPANYRVKVKAGHIATRQWTEQSGKGNFDYGTYDTGRGDFFGVDMYGNSWGSPATTVTTAFTPVGTFLQYVKAYRKSANDSRIRVFPELGYIGAPFDTTGSARAAWIQAIHDEVKTWKVSTVGFDFAGWIWWNTAGKAGASLTGAGTVRWFQLDRRHTGTDGSYTTLNPPLPLQKFNEIVVAESTPAGPVEPTPAELQAAWNAGFAAGEAGKAAAVDSAKTEGFNLGAAQGIPTGRAQGEAAMLKGIAKLHTEHMNTATPIY